MNEAPRLGLSGYLTRFFIASPLTPLFLLAALGIRPHRALRSAARGRAADLRADGRYLRHGRRPQGRGRREARHRAARNHRQGINGVEHVYSRHGTTAWWSRRGSSSARLRTTRSCACTRRSAPTIDRIPIGIPEPLIVGRGINDVAIVALTLSPKPEALTAGPTRASTTWPRSCGSNSPSSKTSASTYIVGGRPEQIRVEPDPEKLSLYGVTLEQLVAKVQDANRSFLAGQVRDDDRSALCCGRADAAGHSRHRTSAAVARATAGRSMCAMWPTWSSARSRSSTGSGSSRGPKDGTLERAPAVTLALAKRAGANAVVVSERIVHRVAELKGSLVPDDVEVAVTATTARPPTRRRTSCCSISGSRRSRSWC